jgi:hypothetical protein
MRRDHRFDRMFNRPSLPLVLFGNKMLILPDGGASGDLLCPFSAWPKRSRAGVGSARRDSPYSEKQIVALRPRCAERKLSYEHRLRVTATFISCLWGRGTGNIWMTQVANSLNAKATRLKFLLAI